MQAGLSVLFAYGFADFFHITARYFLACLILKASITTAADDILPFFFR